MQSRRATVENLFEGRYEILEELPWNGIAYVFRARDERNKLALTVLPIDCDSDKRNVRLFATFCERLESARAAGLVPVIEYGVRHGVPFVAFESIDATTLAEQVTTGFGIQKTIPIVRRLLRATASAHSAKIWHGDLTPSNVLLSEKGGAQIFGLGLWPMIRATRNDNNTGPTGRGSGDNAKHFLAPELLLGERGGNLSDQFSIAALCDFMLRGALPPRPLVAAKSYPKPLQNWVSKAGHVDPKKRFAGSAEALEALNKIYPETDHPLWSATVKSEEVALPVETESQNSSKPLRWLVPLLAIAAIGVAAWFFWPKPAEKSAKATVTANPSTEAVVDEAVVDEVEQPSESSPKAEAVGEADTVNKDTVAKDPVAPEPAAGDDTPTEEDAASATTAKGVKGTLAGPLPPPLDDAMKKVLAGYKFSDDEIKPLYDYARENRSDMRVHIVLARAFMNRRWYTAALERYQQAMKKDMDGVRNNDSTLDDIIRISSRSEDEENFYSGFVLLKRLRDPNTLERIEENLESTKQWRAKLRLERLQKRVTKLEKRRNR